MTAGDRTRVDKITTTSISTEDFAYDTEGRVSSVSKTLTSRAAYPQITDYTYDTLHRVTDVRYPAEYGNGTQPRKVVHHDFDVASRLSGVKVDSVSHASSIVYNPASQTTLMKVGTGTHQITESYVYETLTGLLSNQKVQRSTTTLLDLTYNYLRAGTTSGRTGQLTKITNNLDSGRNRGYEYDALGRLKKATGGATASWTQTYAYDRHGNRTSVTATGTADDGTPIPRDGLGSLAVSLTTNQITGWSYDKAGNQVRAQAPGGGWQRYQYDASNRLVKVKADDNVTVLASYTYGDTNERLMVDEGGLRTYYACDGKVEYTESGSDTSPGWSRSYVYLGGRLLSTLTPNGSGGEAIQHHHADRLGTRLVTTPSDGTSFEQVTLPFGTALPAETSDVTNRRFTSYDRSSATGLDYAVNRHYDSQQGRFTQVDPIGMSAANIDNPQSLNLYAYVQGDPLNFVDPSGLNASCSAEFSYAQCGGDEGFWGGNGGRGSYFGPGGDGGGYAGMPASAAAALSRYLEGLQYTLARLYGTIRALEGFGSSRFGLDLLALQHLQNPPTYTEADEKNITKEAPNPDCDKKLAAIFGGRGAKASGSGYHPNGMMIGLNPALGWNPHLFRTMHLFGNNTGTSPGEVYAPAGGGTPFSREKIAPGQGSWGIHYATLGSVSNVTLVISHVKNYTNPGAVTSYTLIGNIGGPGGTSGGKQPYIHSHLAILDSQGRNISFKDAFCR